MSFTGKLASLFVEFSLSGIDVVQKGIATVQKGLESLAKGAQAFAAQAESAFNKVKYALVGFAAGGLYASSQWQVFQFHLERLARTLAGLFGPEIQKVLDLVISLADKIQNLTDAQREHIVQWVKAGVATLAMSKILPMVLGGIQSIIGGVKALSAAFAASGWGALLMIVGYLAAAFLGIGAGAEVAQNGIGGLWERLKPLMEALKDAGMKILDALQPLLPVFVELFEKVLDAILPLIPIIADALVPVIKLLASVLQLLMELIGPMIELWAKWAKFVTEVVVAIIKKLAEWIQKIVDGVKWLLGVSGGSGSGIGGSLEAAGFTKAKKDDRRGQLPPRVGGIEGIEQMWVHLQEAARMIGGGKSPQERLADTAEKQLAEQKNTTDAVKNIKPDIRSGR